MSNKRRAITLVLVLAACGQTTGTTSPTVTPTDVGDVTTWGVGVRTPLGVKGKPIIESATGRVVGDELLVRFAPGLPHDQIESIVAAAHGLLTYESAATGYDVIRFASVDATSKAERVLHSDRRIAETLYNHVTEGDGISTSPGDRIPNLLYQQWNLYAMGINPFNWFHDAKQIPVAVIDTGAAYEDYSDALGTYQLAPDLKDVTFLPGYDFINNDAHPNDDQRHGTHVTNEIAAAHSIAPVAPNAAIMPIKVLDDENSGTELALAEGIVFAADHGAKVANMSLSFPPVYFPSRLLQEAVDHASQKGLVMVAAAGNYDTNLVAYPAAFRDVIAVGASSIPATYSTHDTHGWPSLFHILERAPYSDSGHKVDVLGPGGTVDTDVNNDGHPEGVLAQTFASGHPTQFGYYYYAGTSQAAAQVSGIVALMLASNPHLDAFHVRALLGDNAHSMHDGVLNEDSGFGLVDARSSLDSARNHHATKERPRYFTNIIVTLHDHGPDTIARAHVEVLDSLGAPVRGATIYGLFTGAAFQSVTATTDAAGQAVIDSGALSGNLVVGFQVDGLMLEDPHHHHHFSHGDDGDDDDHGDDDHGDDHDHGDHDGGHGGWGGRWISRDELSFDRPRGFIRIDSVSLDLLSQFGTGISSGSAISTSPGGISTSPSGSGSSDSGSGISTSPGFPLPSDRGETPISIAFDPALFAGTNYRPTLLLPNFSWGLATSSMAVAVDEDWFLANFPEGASRRVRSYGRGFGDSPFLFDGDHSFPVQVPWNSSEQRVSLIVLTFMSGVTSPSAISTSPGGISTSPGGPRLGVAPTSIFVDRIYGGLGVPMAEQIDLVFENWFTAAAISTSPSSYSGSGMTIGESMYNDLGATAGHYLGFAPLQIAAPAGSYDDTLDAAGMPVAPVSSSVGAGTGEVPE